MHGTVGAQGLRGGRERIGEEEKRSRRDAEFAEGRGEGSPNIFDRRVGEWIQDRDFIGEKRQSSSKKLNGGGCV
jgi:hypothetical protein